MIELYRRMKQSPRAALIKKVGIGVACFVVLAGSGMGLAYITRDKSGPHAAEATKVADTAKNRKQDSSQLLASREDNDKADDDQEVQGAQTTQPGTGSSAGVVQRSEDLKLIAEHQELFVTAASLLGDYEQQIVYTHYSEASALKPKVDAAIAKTKPSAIGADPKASYSSGIMITIQQISDLLSGASSSYAAAIADFEKKDTLSGDAKLADGQAKAAKAEALYKTLVP